MAKTFQATGLMWLGGFGGGGVFGMLEGWKGAANPSMKIRMNSVMNSVSKRGSKTANALAMIAFVHTLASWGVDKLDLDTYTGDTTWTTPIISGFITGSFYKSTASPRAALLAGVIGSGVSAAYSVGGGFVYNELFRKGGRY
jgi:import inner membrane translocase subunit TIM23